MKAIVIGTAGHIDHGKSALVRALTGTDPDRLKEEKDRGSTIDLGFAHYREEDITVLSFVVWLHHFFTMGGGANVNAFFGIATMIISIPTGVKIFNWLFTMYRGRVEYSVPMLWTIGFITVSYTHLTLPTSDLV